MLCLFKSYLFYVYWTVRRFINFLFASCQMLQNIWLTVYFNNLHCNTFLRMEYNLKNYDFKIFNDSLKIKYFNVAQRLFWYPDAPGKQLSNWPTIVHKTHSTKLYRSIDSYKFLFLSNIFYMDENNKNVTNLIVIDSNKKKNVCAPSLLSNMLRLYSR